jgi:anti-sigma factor RsiW
MRCSEIQQKLDLLGTHELTSSMRAQIEIHLHSCTECRQTLATIQQFEALLTSTPAPPVPKGFAVRVVARAKERRAKERRATVPRATVPCSEPRLLVVLQSAWKRLELSTVTAVALAAGLMLGLFLGHETWQTMTERAMTERAMTGRTMAGKSVNGPAVDGSAVNGQSAVGQSVLAQRAAPATQSSALLLVASGFDLSGEPRGDSLADAFLQLTSDRVY